MPLLLMIPAVAISGRPCYDEALRDSILGEITGAALPKTKVNILRYGAKVDGVKDCRGAFAKAMKESRKSGGIHITVPAGEYFMDGPLHLESNVCIELEDLLVRASP